MATKRNDAPTSEAGMFYPNKYFNTHFRSEDVLWLKLSAKNYTPDLVSRGGPNEGDYINGKVFYFLLPPTFSYGYNHDWVDFNTIAGAARSIGAEAKQQLAVAGQTAGAVLGATIGVGSLGQKNDNPFIYQNTQRFTVQIQVSFAVYDDPKADVFDPVRQLIDLSCPEMLGNDALSTEIKFPAVFEVATVTGEMQGSQVLYMRDAALTTILPTWNGPYVRGYPTSATCDLTFTDIYPVYRGWDASKKIKVKVKQGDIQNT